MAELERLETLTNTDGEGSREENLSAEHGVQLVVEEEWHSGDQGGDGVQIGCRNDLSVGDQTVEHTERNVDNTLKTRE